MLQKMLLKELRGENKFDDKHQLDKYSLGYDA
jgi:hypothetical protein